MNRRAFLSSAGAALAATATWPASAQTAPPDDRFEEITALVRARMAEYRVPGVGLGLWHGDTLHLRGFGVTCIDDPRPVTPDTLFTVASISKTMTATAMMKLVEDRRLDLRAPVQKVLPEFRVRDEAASAAVTPWHLLTHTAGWEGQLTTDDRGAQALAHFVAMVMPTLPQLAPPGRVWSYNNAGFALSGRLLEVVTGRPVHDALRDLVFAPLGLSRTFTRLTDAMTHPMTLGHRDRDGGVEVIRPFQTTSSTTAGGVLTSVSDLMRYARFHLGGASVAPAGYLPRPRLDEMQAPQVPKHGTDDEMGIGWHLRRLGGTTTLAHGGTLNGHCLLVELVPSQGLAFTVLTNHVDGWRLVQDVEQAILRRYADLGLTPGQRIGHRGVNEAMSRHSRPLVQQPEFAPYVGAYTRPPVGEVMVRPHGTGLVVGTGAGQPDAGVVFYGTDVAYATSGNYTGFPYEFVRGDDGTVGWVRINGRIARRVG
jgi:CubicO group peptidase (beta-lactamase class C family)